MNKNNLFNKYVFAFLALILLSPLSFSYDSHSSTDVGDTLSSLDESHNFDAELDTAQKDNHGHCFDITSTLSNEYFTPDIKQGVVLDYHRNNYIDHEQKILPEKEPLSTNEPESPLDTSCDLGKDKPVDTELSALASSDGSSGIIAFFVMITDKILQYYDYQDATDFFIDTGALVGKAFARKTGSKTLKNLVFSGDLKPSYYPSETGKFINRNFYETTRNFPKVINDLYPSKNYTKTDEDYRMEGQIIRNSLLNHLGVSVFQIAVSTQLPTTFEYLGLPQSTATSVDSYLNPAVLTYPIRAGFAIMGEFSDETADRLLTLERSGLMWFPETAKTGSIFFAFLIINKLQPGHTLSSLAISEGISSTLVGVGIIFMLAFDNKYAKYEIFNTDSGDFFNPEIQKNLIASSVPVAIESTVSIIGEIAKYYLDMQTLDEDGKYLMGVIKAKTALLGYLVDPLSVVNVKIHKNLESNLKKTGESKLVSGILINAILASPYLVLFAAPSFIAGKDAPTILLHLTRVDQLGKYLLVVDRVRKEGVQVYGQEQQGWAKTGTLVAGVVVPVVGYTLIKTNTIEHNLRNNVIIKSVSMIPTIIGLINVVSAPIINKVKDWWHSDSQQND